MKTLVQLTAQTAAHMLPLEVSSMLHVRPFIKTLKKCVLKGPDNKLNNFYCFFLNETGVNTTTTMTSTAGCHALSRAKSRYSCTANANANTMKKAI